MENASTNQNQHNAKVSMILAGISIVGWLIPIIGLPLSIIALVFGFRAKSQTMAKVAIVIAIITLLAGVANAGLGAKRGAERAKQVETTNR